MTEMCSTACLKPRITRTVLPWPVWESQLYVAGPFQASIGILIKGVKSDPICEAIVQQSPGHLHAPASFEILND